MKRIGIIAGGGTGGHLYPGIAVARELQTYHPDIEIHFVGSKQGLESRIVPKEGFPLHVLPVGGLVRTGRWAQLKTLLLMPWVLVKSLLLLMRLRPAFVLGIGGFAAGPFVLVASFFVKATFIWEPNAHPGLTNRLLSRFVKTAFVVFEAAGRRLKSPRVKAVGLPVRKAMVPSSRPASSSLRVLVFGGSQGARAINNAVSEAFVQANWSDSVELVHQTGPLDYGRISKMYHNVSGVQCFEYIEDMPKYFAWADLVIARGGAGSVSEIIACQKAAIIVPLPTAAENHQQANAEVLVRAHAGEMVLQKDFTPKKVIEMIEGFLKDRSLIAKLEDSIKSLQKPGGAAAIAETIAAEAGLT